MRPFTSISMDSVSRDTVLCLRQLIEEVERGEVVGVAYAAIHRHRHYSTHACGEAWRNPMFSAGIVGALWFDLQMQARGGP
jgi:hypothetical protein